jgi:reactive intermediate/imine deaminase
MKDIISTERAPRAIGTYSQAVRSGNLVFMSGQVALDPATGQLISGDFEAEARRVFENLKAVAAAAGGTLDQAVKVTVFLTDFADFAKLNEVMAQYVREPYPARAAIGVASLPRGARVEVECILSLG